MWDAGYSGYICVLQNYSFTMLHMTSYKKTIVALCVAAAVAGGLYVVTHARESAESMQTPLAIDLLSAPEFSGATSTLSQEERDGIVRMREEEKLARDVYLTLGEKYSLPIFTNIAASESTHIAAMAVLISRYSLVDPVKDDSIGVFTSPVFSQLYTSMVHDGTASDFAALRVGALIEELDIADLTQRIAQTQNPDIIAVYENLMRGSRNHLRSFTAQLAARNVSYEPMYLSADGYAAIIHSPRETGRNR